VYWACGTASDALLLSLARSARPTAAQIFLLWTLQQARDALEVVDINRLRDALCGHIKARVSSFSVDPCQFDTGQCVGDLCIIWAWASSKAIPLPAGGVLPMRVGKRLDAVTRAYFSHLCEQGGDTRPCLFTRRDINCKALADLINTITPAAKRNTTTSTETTNQQICSYVDALKALAAFYHGKRSHPPPAYPFGSPPDVHSITQALDLGKVPSGVSGAFSSHRSGYEMDVVVSALHPQADDLRQSSQQAVELRAASHCLHGRIEKRRVESNAAADDEVGVVHGHFTCQKPTRPPPAPLFLFGGAPSTPSPSADETPSPAAVASSPSRRRRGRGRGAGPEQTFGRGLTAPSFETSPPDEPAGKRSRRPERRGE